MRRKEKSMKPSKALFWLLVVLFLATISSTALAQSKPIELSLGLIVPPKHLRYLTVMEPWIKMVEERTKGAVKINPYFTMTLAPV